VILPAIVVIARTSIRPFDADDGELLLHVDGGLAAVRTEFPVPASIRRPVYLRAFAQDDGLILVPSRPDQLVLT
jgi:hypothetical protein